MTKKPKAKLAPKQKQGLSGKELSRFVRETFYKRGIKAFEAAKKAVLEEADKLESPTVKQALHFFVSYWKDTTRPALLSIACESLGGDPAATSPVAVPLILVCGAVDIHDDIIDQSKTKRNHLTLYGKFGKEIALLVGNALLFKGFAMLCEDKTTIQPKQKEAIIKIIKNLFFELGDAEALELPLRGKKNLSPNEYLSLVRKKAADFEAYMRVSAVLANASKQEVEALGEYGRILGMLVVLGDDNADVLDPAELVNRIRNE
ncbi:polyprenyl synthetase family protein, partial [Candidatus Bathyarchaeota archaeon]|nr:polyprenyl synthetase family protein [Candidatus Bathyarchaeota archaeon]